MKKLLYTIIGLISFVGFTQTYTTEQIPLTTGFTAQIDVTNSLVTLTLVGPSTDYLALAFDCTSMGDIGSDVVMFAGSPTPTISDRTFIGVGSTPPLDTNQNWTVTSNTINNGVRTVVATRERNTGDTQDYVFPLSAQPLNLVWGKRPNSLVVGYHGNGNCGTTIANLSLSSQKFNLDSFKFYPNPSKDFLTLELPIEISSGELKIYNQEGKVVIKENVSKNNNKIGISNLAKGTYIVVLRTEQGNATSRLIID
jgi:Secretion system C-terminal sorting domain/DOMON domain